MQVQTVYLGRKKERVFVHVPFSFVSQLIRRHQLWGCHPACGGVAMVQFIPLLVPVAIGLIYLLVSHALRRAGYTKFESRMEAIECLVIAVVCAVLVVRVLL